MFPYGPRNVLGTIGGSGSWLIVLWVWVWDEKVHHGPLIRELVGHGRGHIRRRGRPGAEVEFFSNRLDQPRVAVADLDIETADKVAIWICLYINLRHKFILVIRTTKHGDFAFSAGKCCGCDQGYYC